MAQGRGTARISVCVPVNDLAPVSRSESSVAVAVQRTRTSMRAVDVRDPATGAVPGQFTGIVV